MTPGVTSAVSRPVLMVVALEAGGWRVAIEGLPPSDYETREEACAEAEAYVSGHGGGGEIVIGPAAASGPEA